MRACFERGGVLISPERTTSVLSGPDTLGPYAIYGIPLQARRAPSPCRRITAAALVRRPSARPSVPVRRDVIGIEINREWAEVARERVWADVSGSDYAARHASLSA